MGFSAIVKQACLSLGISQEVLAHALNVSFVTIQLREERDGK
jgi:transcriptional regulator with XRE-family HTH domain